MYNEIVVYEIHQKGEAEMTNTELLEKAIKDSGLKKGFIAGKLGLSRAGLANCINNRAEFKLSHVGMLCDLLKLDVEQRNAIFFARSGV